MSGSGPKVVDLFSGCGGLSFGLSQVGFDIVLGSDSWKDSLDTFLLNHRGSNTLLGDIRKITSKEIARKAGKIDLIVGGPPCQGFSLTGPRNFYDKRNTLYLEFLRVVKDLKPQGFIIENVPGLANLFGGQVKERIIEEFSKIGYTVNSKILNASDYGVPQNRKRIVFVGLRSKKKFEFPVPTHFDEKSLPIFDKKITVWDAIGDLPLLDGSYLGEEIMNYPGKPLTDYQRIMRKGSRKLYNHVAANHDKRTIEIISHVPEGKNYKSLPEKYRNIRNFHVAWTRLDRNKPAPTIDTGHRHHFHPTANRVPTVRESARLQSFPDTFIFTNSKTSQYVQVGNAVPPILAKKLGEKVLEYFDV